MEAMQGQTTGNNPCSNLFESLSIGSSRAHPGVQIATILGLGVQSEEVTHDHSCPLRCAEKEHVLADVTFSDFNPNRFWKRSRVTRVHQLAGWIGHTLRTNLKQPKFQASHCRDPTEAPASARRPDPERYESDQLEPTWRLCPVPKLSELESF